MKKAVRKIGKRIVEIILFSGIMIYLLFFFLKHFVFGFYQVPSGSMLGTIWPGDWIIAEKVSYGPRISWNGKLYRIPGLSAVERGDVLVFNFPEGDTVFITNPTTNYYEQVRCQAFFKKQEKMSLYEATTTLPVNLRLPYVKRCVGLPGDTLIIKDGDVNVCPRDSSWQINDLYRVFCKSKALVTIDSIVGYPPDMLDEYSCKVIALSADDKDKLEQLDCIDKIEPKIDNRIFISTFPFVDRGVRPWSLVAYGPVVIPARGCKLELNMSNINTYKRVIDVYENNELQVRNDSIFINRKHCKSYTFKQDYYFVMGDNRSFSFDSRNWGFVPEDHIIGRVFMLGWSRNIANEFWNDIRWNRVGKIVK